MEQLGQPSRLVPVWTVRCVMCGRSPGQIVRTRFVRDRSEAPPRGQRGAARCGACGGNLYLEAEPSVSPAAAARLAEQATAEPGLRTDPVR